MSARSSVPTLGSHTVKRTSRRLRALMGVASMGAVALTPLASAAKPQPGRVLSASRLQEGLRGHSFKSLDGKPLALRTAEAQVVILNFWASWCAPCRKELPQLDALNATLAKQGARIIAVSIDAEAANARRFQEKHALSLPIAFDGPDGLVRRLDLPSIPFTLVIDRDGRVAYSTQQSDARALAALESTTRRLLQQGPTAESAEGSRP